MRSIIAAVFLLIATLTFAQSDDVAKRVYKSSENSIFLVYLNDSNGIPTALGSAFVVGPRTLITNAHVVDAGDPVLAVGPVRIPVKILKKDEKNDLAVISVAVDLTSTSLPLAKEAVTPGELIFAMGNPDGLEKTISQGIISGLRTHGDRDLLQITSPISHGSSGGPILDVNGQVVGVAVGLMEDGQNLNFAVPVRFVQQLLETQISPVSPAGIFHSASEVVTLAAKKNSEEYSDNEDSQYQQDSRRLKEIMPSALTGAKNSNDLISLACVGTRDIELSDNGIRAARRLLSEHPSPESRALLSYAIYQRSYQESLTALFAKDSSPEKNAALTRQESFALEAEHEASRAGDEARGKHLPVAMFVLGNVKEDRKDYAGAVLILQQILVAKPNICENDLTLAALRSLIRDSDLLDRPGDAERWFRQFADTYSPGPYDWDSEGDRRAKANDPASAADAYERATSGGAYFSADYCYAAIDRYLQPTTDADRVLSDGRACIDASIKNADKNKEAEYKAKLPIVYRFMASVLADRGVNQPALEYVKEALAGSPNDSSSLDIEATIYANLGRYSECIAAAQAAISTSDGKFPYMHFRLGYCYFQTENWTMAAASFKLAADGDTTDAISAYNLGLSLERQGFSVDAQPWFSEALRRKPDADLRAKILHSLGK
jgi:tetratricopeptide (TPR) repeat protein